MTTPVSILFLNGPNANLYGLDPSGVYGTESFPALQARCESHAKSIGVTLDFRQSNDEGNLIDWIQEGRETVDALVINAAGLTYTSIAILDALLAFPGPIIEAHMSNIWKRESFRHHSYVSRAATGVVARRDRLRACHHSGRHTRPGQGGGGKRLIRHMLAGGAHDLHHFRESGQTSMLVGQQSVASAFGEVSSPPLASWPAGEPTLSA